LDPDVIATVQSLNWNSPESRQQVALALGTSPSSESLIGALLQILTTELSQARSAAAAAIVSLDSGGSRLQQQERRTASRDGLLVFDALCKTLYDEHSMVRAATAEAIANSLSSRLNSRRIAFPDWFIVLKICSFLPAPQQQQQQ